MTHAILSDTAISVKDGTFSWGMDEYPVLKEYV